MYIFICVISYSYILRDYLLTRHKQHNEQSYGMLRNMYPSPLLLSHLIEATHLFWVVPLIIILGALFLEDITIISVGILSASNYFPLPMGIGLLIIGVVLSDLLAYSVGRLAIHHNIARRIVEHHRIAPLRLLIKKRPKTVIFTTRFMPGFRFAMYLTCGFFRIPFQTFISISIFSAFVWSTILATLSFLFGIYTLNLLGYWRFPILAMIIIILFYVGHRHWKKMLGERNEELIP